MAYGLIVVYKLIKRFDYCTRLSVAVWRSSHNVLLLGWD